MRLVIVMLLLLTPFAASAELIPAERLYVGWTNAGVIGGIPVSSNMTVYTNIAPADASTISSAIAACPSNQVVQLEAGTFTMSELDIVNNGNWVLRGSGKSATILNFGANLCRLRSSVAGDWPPRRSADASLTANAAKDATTVTVNTPGATAVGRFINLFQTQVTNDANNIVLDATGIATSQSHLTVVTGISGNDVSFLDPLPFALNTNQSAAFSAYIATDKIADIGIENMTITSTRSGPVIEVWGAYNSWFKNVKISRTNTGFILAYYVSSHCTVFGCELTGAGTVVPNQFGIGTGAIGTYIIPGTGSSLFENNIIKDIFPFFEINGGSTANVIAYNYLPELTDSDMGIDLNHGGHNSYNLIEGNLSPNIKPDGYFSSVSHDTILRNRITGLEASAPIDLKRLTRSYNIVGNVLGTIGNHAGYETTDSGFTTNFIYALGFPNIGNHVYTGTAEPSTGDWWADWPTGASLPSGFQELDLDVANTLVRKGNYNYYDSAIPAGESLGGDSLPNSYYLSGKPTWFGNLTWPPYDPANPVNDFADNKVLIPAGYLDAYGTNPPAGAPDTNPPSITSGDATGTNAVAFSYQITYTGGGTVTNYGASNLPGGLSVNSGSGLINGTPNETVTNSVTLTATNSYAGTNKVVTFTILPPGEPPADITNTVNALNVYLR